MLGSLLFILSACAWDCVCFTVFVCRVLLILHLAFTQSSPFSSAFSGVSIFFPSSYYYSLLCFVPHTTSSIRTISFGIFFDRIIPFSPPVSFFFFTFYCSFLFMPFFLVGAVAFIHMYCAEIVVFKLVLACHSNTCDTMLPWRKYIQFESSKKKKNWPKRNQRR